MTTLALVRLLPSRNTLDEVNRTRLRKKPSGTQDIAYRVLIEGIKLGRIPLTVRRVHL